MSSKKQVIKIYVDKDEYQQICAISANCQLSLSTFAKRLCLGYQPPSKADAQAVLELLRVNADLGRLGGLLKFWLSEPDRNANEVRRLLHELEAAKEELIQKVRAL